MNCVVKFSVALLLPFVAALPVTAAPPQKEILAHYKVYKSGILVGTVEERLTREGDNYRIVSDTQTAGAVRLLLRDQLILTVTGKVIPRGLAPATYELKRQGDARKDVSTSFDRERGKIISKRPDKTEEYELPAGTLDRISAMYQFAFDAPLAAEVTFWMSQGKEAERYRYRKVDEPSIRVGDTSYATLHYVRDSAPGRPQAELWLARDKNLLPVRMIFEDSRGLALEQTLVDLRVQ